MKHLSVGSIRIHSHLVVVVVEERFDDVEKVRKMATNRSGKS